MTKNTGPLMGSIKFSPGLDSKKVLDESLKVFFKDCLRVGFKNPIQGYHLAKTLKCQTTAAGVRRKWKDQGLEVPPILILSITNRCNLRCKGCYNWALRPDTGPEMDKDKIIDVIKQASVLGISFIMIAGGEPLTRPELLDITAMFPRITFLVFTNGTLITKEIVSRLKKQRHFIPVLSLEGQQIETDDRRGEGVFASITSAASKLSKAGLFWAVSITVTRENFDAVTREDFIVPLLDKGCKLVFFVEYTPVSEQTADLYPTASQRARLTEFRDELRSKFEALFIAIPGDEDEIGGCLAAGKGFVHINALGDVEPCPFAPYSDANLKDVTLAQALQSDFLRKIREGRAELTDEGGCSLWMNRQWVESLIEKRE